MGKSVKVIAGKYEQAEGPIKGHNVEPIYFDVELKKSKEFNFNLPSTHNSFVYLINGEIKIGNKTHNKVSGATLFILANKIPISRCKGCYILIILLNFSNY